MVPKFRISSLLYSHEPSLEDGNLIRFTTYSRFGLHSKNQQFSLVRTARNHGELKFDSVKDIDRISTNYYLLCVVDDDIYIYKMITNSGDKDFQAKQEISNNNINSKITSKASTSSRSWSGLKDPRIVRVSRTFGGKDRHSKVCTIRGLRDRRVRLSVPTAIQLYDLQDRLGLNQPSKVVDWLLNAAKDEIDELPPLQIPPGTFAHFPQPMLASHEANQIQSSFASLVDSYVKDEENQTTGSKSKYWNLNSSPLRSKCKEVAHETAILSDDQRSNWGKRSKQQAETQEDHDHQVQNNPLTRTTLSSSASLQNSMMPFNSYYHWDPSNLSLSHLGSHGFSSQSEDIPHNYNVVSMAAPSSTPWSLPSGSQVLVCPSGTTPSQLFQPFVTTSTPQLNHFQMLGTNSSSASQNPHLNSLTPSLYSIGPTMRPVQLGVIPKLAHSDNSNNIAGAHESNRSTGSTTSLSYAFHNHHPTQS